MSNSNCEKITCGALKSPDDSRDWSYEALARGSEDTLPEEFSYMGSPVRDQGAEKLCAAFAGAAIKEIHCRQDGVDITLSPHFIYHHRINKGTNGMYGRNVFQILNKIGTVPAEMITDDIENMSTYRYNKLVRHAKKYRINHYARVGTIRGLKRAIIEAGPCYLSLPLCKQRPYFWRPENGEIVSEGHATVVIGYDREGFILRNSWGEDWNGDGHVVFPYADWGCHIECWVVINGDSSKKTNECTIL